MLKFAAPKGKNKGLAWFIGVVVVAALVGFAYTGGQNLYNKATGKVAWLPSSTADVQMKEVQNSGAGAWKDSVVNYKLSFKDKYNGSTLNPSVKIYSLANKPADFGNARGDFSDSDKYESYTASSGAITVADYPGDYIAVITLSGYNTQFVEKFTIPDGTGMKDSLSDYNSAPLEAKVKLAQLPTLTLQNVSKTLTNQSAVQKMSDYAYVTVGENTELRGWKVVVNDVEGMKDDADNDGTYDEGISRLKISIGDKSETVFEPAKGVNKFDTNSKYEIPIDGVIVSDGAQLAFHVETDALTSDTVVANDETWGEGEGTLARLDIFDAQGTNRGAVYIVG